MKTLSLTAFAALVAATFHLSVAAIPLEVGSASQVKPGCAAPAIEMLPFVVREDHTLTLDQLQTLATPLSGWLTLAAVSVQPSLSATVRSTPGCRTLAISAGYTNPILRVAMEIPTYTCGFRLLYAHEQEHVKAYQAALAVLPEQIRERITTLELPADDYEAGKVLEQALQPVLEQVLTVQAGIDSPAAYEANSKRCHGELVAFLRR